jgi:hypothetical protein
VLYLPHGGGSAERAGHAFDAALAKGCTHVLLRGRKASFALARSLPQIEALQQQTPGARILPMERPVSRIQFIAWVLKPKRSAN